MADQSPPVPSGPDAPDKEKMEQVGQNAILYAIMSSRDRGGS